MKNGKITRYDDDLIIRRYSGGSLIKPKPEVLKEIKKAFFPEPSHPKPPGVYFHVHDLEIADMLGCWDKEYYWCSYGEFLELIGKIFSEPQIYADSCERDYIPIIFGTDKDEVLRRAREMVIDDEPTTYPNATTPLESEPKGIPKDSPDGITSLKDKVFEKETENKIIPIKKGLEKKEEKKDE